MFLALARKTCAGTAVDRRNAHVPHEPGHARAARVDVEVAAEHVADLARTEGGILQVDFVDEAAERGVVFGELGSGGSEPVAVDFEELALAAHAQGGIGFDHGLALLHSPSSLDFFASHSTSMVSWPILRSRRARSRSAASSSFLADPPRSKTAAAPSSKSFFHWPTSTGCKSCSAAISLIVLAPRAASKATRALNSGVKFLRVFFFMVLGRNLPRTLPLSILKSNQDSGSVRRGHLWHRSAIVQTFLGFSF